MKRNICIQYFIWYFIDVPKDILDGWRNFLVFNLNYFSVPTLLGTFFSHWHRYSYSYGDKFRPARYFEAIVFNGFSRFVGIIFRTFFIIIGLLIEILIIIIGLIVFLGWFILPILFLIAFLISLAMIF